MRFGSGRFNNGGIGFVYDCGLTARGYRVRYFVRSSVRPINDWLWKTCVKWFSLAGTIHTRSTGMVASPVTKKTAGDRTDDHRCGPYTKMVLETERASGEHCGRKAARFLWVRVSRLQKHLIQTDHNYTLPYHSVPKQTVQIINYDSRHNHPGAYKGHLNN